MWLFSASAVAAPPTIIENGDEIRVSVVVQAPLDRVLGFLRDPRNPAALYDGKITFAAREDGCFDQRFEASYGVMAVSYLALTCPTASGTRSQLVQSDSFEDLAFRWEAVPLDSGIEIAYTYRGVLKLPIPKWMVRRSTRNATVELVERVAATLTQG